MVSTGAYLDRDAGNVLLFAGGFPKNLSLQAELQIHEVPGLPQRVRDVFLPLTDAGPDADGLSGATPSGAVS
jgi:deoxyhypusine synthase